MENKIEKANKMWLMLVWLYIAIMAIALETSPALIDAKGILAVLVVVMISSKITGQFYYSRVKKEIGF